MPLYEFVNTETNEVFDLIMKISEKEQYLRDNPHIQALLSAPVMMDPVRVGVRKPDNGFKEVLQRIHEKTPGSRLDKTSNI
ncbi:MAG: hypothetical protein EBU90_18005 [Proteobacteria bacterium]|nr:hypothetical protein [Pseudomonadota bacterium]NBP15424.1 hypothetical protein [bacterium]